MSLKHAGAAMPNITFDTLESVPEGLREYAKVVDGKHVVEVVPGVKLDEFRTNNVNLSKARDELAATLGKLKPHIGESVEEFLTRLKELETTAAQVKDGKLKGTDAIEAEVNNRVSTMKTGYENQLTEAARRAAEAEQRAAAADEKFNRSIVERGVTEAVVNEKSGALPSALHDILTRAYRVFQVAESGKLVAKDGDAIIYGADGVSPMTPMEWMTKLRTEAPHLFKGSNGGGATGNAGSKAEYGGMTEAAFKALPAAQRLAIYHANKAKK